MTCVWLQEGTLYCLMEFAAAEGQYPLQDLDWSEHYSFPRELIKVGFCSVMQASHLWAVIPSVMLFTETR